MDVTEEGTEAAAATGAVMMMRSMPIVRPFHADRPFVFFIIDNRVDSVLFAGHVYNPLGTADGASQTKQEL